jgi:hypothetical protein
MAGGSSLCIEGRILPLYGAHVAHEQFNFCRPRSTISQSDFRQVIRSSSPRRLVGPYKLRLNLTDLPFSHEILWLHVVGTNPGSTPEHSRLRILGFRLPHLGDRVGYFHLDESRGYLSVHLRSGLQPPCLRLSGITQDSVRGCVLGFTAVAISGN